MLVGRVYARNRRDSERKGLPRQICDGYIWTNRHAVIFPTICNYCAIARNFLSYRLQQIVNKDAEKILIEISKNYIRTDRRWVIFATIILLTRYFFLSYLHKVAINVTEIKLIELKENNTREFVQWQRKMLNVPYWNSFTLKRLFMMKTTYWCRKHDGIDFTSTLSITLLRHVTKQTAKNIESFHSLIRHNQIAFAPWLTWSVVMEEQYFVTIHSIKWRLLLKFGRIKTRIIMEWRIMAAFGIH